MTSSSADFFCKTVFDTSHFRRHPFDPRIASRRGYPTGRVKHARSLTHTLLGLGSGRAYSVIRNMPAIALGESIPPDTAHVSATQLARCRFC